MAQMLPFWWRQPASAKRSSSATSRLRWLVRKGRLTFSYIGPNLSTKYRERWIRSRYRMRKYRQANQQTIALLLSRRYKHWSVNLIATKLRISQSSTRPTMLSKETHGERYLQAGTANASASPQRHLDSAANRLLYSTRWYRGRLLPSSFTMVFYRRSRYSHPQQLTRRDYIDALASMYRARLRQQSTNQKSSVMSSTTTGD